MSKKRRQFTPEYKAEVVSLVQTGKSIGSVARDLGLTESAVDRWVKQAREAQKKAKVPLDGSERTELELLRKENARLRMEREILKKAAAFFANENK